MNLKGPLHFVGISGSGMAPLAEACSRLGIVVTGYDQQFSDYSKNLGLFNTPISQDPQFDFGLPNAIVISSAIPSNHPQVLLAAQKKIPVLHRSDVLANLIESHSSIAIAGTHGKTSTTGMVAQMLHHLNLEPLAIVGGKLLDHGSSFLFGPGPRVVEADESDGTFLKYHPDIAVVTNIEADHMDYWKNIEHLKEGFKKFLMGAKEGSPVIVGWDSPIIREICQDLSRDILGYGFSIGSHVRATDIQIDGIGSRFLAIVEKDKIDCRIRLPGKHNILNALAALCVARAKGINLKKAAEGLESFSGVSRRFEPVYQSNRRLIFNDYAHNPGKIAAACSVLREYFPDSRKIVVFQPHRYSRLQSLMDGFAEAFNGMDLVFVTDVYSAGEKVDAHFTPESLSNLIRRGSAVDCRPFPKEVDLISVLAPPINQKDVILFVGAGDIGKYIDTLLGLV